jgi:hypothetical protein
MTTKQQKYEKEIREFCNRHFKTYDYKHINYVEPKGYSLQDGAFIIETKNCGLVYIHPDLATSMRPYGYCIYTQKFAKKWYNEEEGIFEFSNDSRFKKNNLLCMTNINTIKDFILSEYESI